MADNKRRDIHGWVVLDKPSGISSNGALGRVKRFLGAAKAGHAGTLDPLATGLLPIALGEATKTVSFVVNSAKTYRFTVTWGMSTTTDDCEGEPVSISEARPSRAEILDRLPAFTGRIMQKPPAFSAIKVKGRRAYELARRGSPPDLPPREVVVDRFELLDTPSDNEAVFETSCEKGTYIRALARDLAVCLGTAGHVSALRRTRVGRFRESDMISLDKLERLSHIGAGQTASPDILLPVETALDDIPVLAVSGEQARRLRLGQVVEVENPEAPDLQGIVFVSTHGRPVAMAEYELGALHPKRVFNI